LLWSHTHSFGLKCSFDDSPTLLRFSSMVHWLLLQNYRIYRCFDLETHLSIGDWPSNQKPT
jgi:hypothetical protein